MADQRLVEFLCALEMSPGRFSIVIVPPIAVIIAGSLN